MPVLARQILADLLAELRHLDERVEHYDRQLEELASQSEPARRLMVIDGIGPITATALVASVGNAQVFKNGRQFAAWLGLTQRQHASGGRSRLGRITKRGDRYLRTLLVHGARVLLRFVARRPLPQAIPINTDFSAQSKTWLLTITRNTALDVKNRADRQRTAGDP